MSAAPRPGVVIAATPTSNGDLHVGHMAGPYLAGDVYARYRRATGLPTVYTTCTDDSQSYVVTTARRQGEPPEELCSTSTAAIQRSLDALAIEMAPLPPVDDLYRDTVLRFVDDLRRAGRLRLATVRLPYGARSGACLYDGFLSGTCPSCLAASAGGVCEGCGHPVLYDGLLDAKSTVDPSEEVVLREKEILVLPLEDYREQLTAYYQARRGLWRPHAMQVVEELLSRPLPEVPVTIPGTWGVPVPFPETPGQVLYPWVEAVPASMYATWWSLSRRGEAPARVDELWLAEHDAEIVYFHGFDNTYHWGLLDLALLMAHGERYQTPESNVCNEFYELDGAKFSTSRGHLVWTMDLLRTVPRDLVRFHLALTAPEYQRSGFDAAALRAGLTDRLVRPWNALADELSLALLGTDLGTPVATTATGRARSAVMTERFRGCYELRTFSPARAAETVVDQLARLRATAAVLLADGDAEGLGDLLMETRTVLAWAAPLLVDAADRARAAGIDLNLGAAPPDSVPAFLLPRLPGAEIPDTEAALSGGGTQ